MLPVSLMRTSHVRLCCAVPVRALLLGRAGHWTTTPGPEQWARRTSPRPRWFCVFGAARPVGEKHIPCCPLSCCARQEPYHVVFPVIPAAGRVHGPFPYAGHPECVPAGVPLGRMGAWEPPSVAAVPAVYAGAVIAVFGGGGCLCREPLARHRIICTARTCCMHNRWCIQRLEPQARARWFERGWR